MARKRASPAGGAAASAAAAAAEATTDGAVAKLQFGMDLVGVRARSTALGSTVRKLPDLAELQTTVAAELARCRKDNDNAIEALQREVEGASDRLKKRMKESNQRLCNV
eukprot:jgi/Chlat1/9118/Chrsp97S09279